MPTDDFDVSSEYDLSPKANTPDPIVSLFESVETAGPNPPDALAQIAARSRANSATSTTPPPSGPLKPSSIGARLKQTFDMKNRHTAPVSPFLSDNPQSLKQSEGANGAAGANFRVLQDMQHASAKGQDVAKGVRYFNDANERQKYRVEIGARMTRRGMLFDTEKVFQKLYAGAKHSARSEKFDQDFARYEELKKKDDAAVASMKAQGLKATPASLIKPSMKGMMTSAHFGKDASGAKFATPAGWSRQALIWVCAPDENDKASFYSHACKSDSLHHSSFAAGGGVIGAGEWVVYQGRLARISGNSGHYRTRMDSLYRSVLHMSAAFHAETVVLLFDTSGNSWIDYPIREFISRPTDGGRLKVHPDSPS